MKCTFYPPSSGINQLLTTSPPRDTFKVEEVEPPNGDGAPLNTPRKRRATYFDDNGFYNFVFIRWVPYWVRELTKSFFEPEMVHPLPEADSISYWQPIFSKHISDGLVMLERAEAERLMHKKPTKRVKPYRSILMRALILTFWRRILIILVGIVVMNILNVATAVLLKSLLNYMSDNASSILTVVSLVVIIVCAELFHSISEQHLLFYNTRLENLVESALTITIFQHGLCHRKDYSRAIENVGLAGSCKCVVHSYPQTNSQCSHNPLLCPARRYQNRELSPSVYTYFYIDTGNLSMLLEAIIIIIRFICTFILGMILIRTQIGMKIFTPVLIIMGIILAMTLVELINGCLLKHMLQCKDRRITMTSDIAGNLNLLKTMAMEDVGYNAIENCRNDEVSILMTRTFLYSINTTLIRSLGVVVFLNIILDYIKEMKAADSSKTFDITAPITVLFVINKIVSSVENLPKTMKVLVEAVTSARRIGDFLRSCSPNYYHSYPDTHDPSNQLTDTLAQDTQDSPLDHDTVVLYKDATFTWINRREDTLKAGNDTLAVFAGMDFQLKKGDIKIITGSQGCGKSSFIKTMLGEMSLVSGSMAVAPLATGMPIFYTSQEVWLPSGTIRSVITFGYAFDKEVYDEVIKAAELESDFYFWEDGDSRVISEKGHSLSGGQRVRISLARALYAYKLFSKANDQLESNRCCFLVCLDEPFNGLDPTVAASIFRNLFNKSDGLLVKDDVAVVIAISKMNLDICFNNTNLIGLSDISICHISGKSLLAENSIQVYVEQDDFQKGSVPLDDTPTCSIRKTRSLRRLPANVLRSCETGNIAPMKSSHAIYKNMSHSASEYNLESQKRLCSTASAYVTYFSAMGYVACAFVFLTLLAAIVLEKANSIWVARWCDSIKELGGNQKGHTVVNTATVVAKHERTAMIISILSSCYIFCVFLGMMMVVFGNILCCKRLHTFALDSLFHRSSSELKLKKSMGALVTFFSSDTFYIDEYLSKSFIFALFCILNIVFQFVTICYTIPIAAPVPILLFTWLYFYVVKCYCMASKKLQVLMLDAMSDINAVYSNVMAGPSLYRSYRKEKQCMQSIYDRSDSYYRVKFMRLGLTTWVMVDAKLSTCAMICFVSFIPILYSYLRNETVNIAHVGLGISLSMGFTSVLTNFIYNFTVLEKQMCSMSRYESYFIQNKYSLKERFDSMGETILSGHFHMDECTKDEDRKKRAELCRRRRREYKNFMFRKYRSILSTLFYRPKIDLINTSRYLPNVHTNIDLRNVCVPQSSSDPTAGSYILRGVCATASAAEIIGIVGRTGAGKSTLLSVLQDIARKREGDVLLDGRDLNTIPRSVIRHVIGVLPQLPYIFKGWTLRRFLDPRMLYKDDEILTALECCGLLQFVRELPGGSGLNTVLMPEEIEVKGGLYLFPPIFRLKYKKRCPFRCGGPSGMEDAGITNILSTNQLRMLTFARLVLYRRSYRILLIDEPPSDNCAARDDQELFESSTQITMAEIGLPIYDLVKLYFRHCTTFIVAHDKNALKSCTSLWIMRNGRLVRECTSAEFLEDPIAIMNSVEGVTEINGTKS